MNDLTEQWKNGELNRNKIYYYETPFNTTDTASGFWLCNHLDTEKDKVQILGEVPSYEEYQLMQDDNKRLKHDVGNLGYKIKNQRHEIDNRLKEIEKLKELLKECSPYISRSATSRMIKNSVGFKKDMKLFTKIDEVLK